jgi:hypothetical protein
MFCVLLKNSFTTHLEPERELPGQAIIVCNRDITYSWKGLTRIHTVGSRISHMRLAKSQDIQRISVYVDRYTLCILV